MIVRNLASADINDINFWNKLVNDLRNFLIKFPDTQNKILTINLREIVNDDTSLIPKLEYFVLPNTSDLVWVVVVSEKLWVKRKRLKQWKRLVRKNANNHAAEKKLLVNLKW